MRYWDIIPASVGIIQAMIFSFLILSKKSISTKDRLLTIWFLVFSIHLGLIILVDFESASFALVLAKTLTLLHGPFFLLYTKRVFGQFRPKLLIHFFPFFLFLVSGVLISSGTSANLWEMVLTFIKMSTLLGYPAYVLYRVKGGLVNEPDNRTDSQTTDLRWIKSVAWLMMTYAFLGFTHVLAELLLNLQFSGTLDLAIYALMITMIGFLGLKFGRLYTPELAVMPASSKPYKNSPLSTPHAMEIRNKVDAYLENTDAFLNPAFNLSLLSEKLHTPKHHLSEVINHVMETTFYDLVNSRRVEHAKQRMLEQSEANISLEGLGYECGFNTKSAFYQHFKNFTGKTPGQFRAEMRPD